MSDMAAVSEVAAAEVTGEATPAAEGGQ